jgi:hypothetical protein
MSTNLKTTNEVIDALGGVRAVADLTRRRYSAAYNWRKFKTFPSNTFLAMQAALAEKGLTAPPSLWRMVKPPQQKRAA